MARYDYKCPACETVFEVEHPMSEHPEVTCPACGHVANKVFGAAGIVFKGSGFYNTDQRGRGARGAASPATSSSTGSDSESSASSDTASTSTSKSDASSTSKDTSSSSTSSSKGDAD